MKNITSSICQAALIGGLFLSPNITPAFADQSNSCSQNCASALKECRRTADAAANTEWHSLIRGNSNNRVQNNGQLTPIVNNEYPSGELNEGTQQRKMERYQECATLNDNCLRPCTPTPETKKTSVIFK
jgi:hypothetical protein